MPCEPGRDAVAAHVNAPGEARHHTWAVVFRNKRIPAQDDFFRGFMSARDLFLVVDAREAADQKLRCASRANIGTED